MPAFSLPLAPPVPVTPASDPPNSEVGPVDWHVFGSAGRDYVYVADGSRIYEIGKGAAELLRRLRPGGGAESALALSALGIAPAHAVSDDAPAALPLRSLSLAVAQKCNLACSYCYAEGGDFGGEAKVMPLSTALAAVERLFADCPPGGRVNLAFLGGEPLLARDVLRAATEYAAQLGRARGVAVGLSVTTNGTLVTADDGEFFDRHGFAVTVSLDGVGAAHDRQRSFKGGRGSFDHILVNVRPLLARQRRMQVSARVTVTPRNLDLPATLDGLIGLGFHSVGFSPMLASPTGQDQMGTDHLAAMLTQMIACGQEFERRVVAGERYPFSNMASAVAEIHKGTHRPYPCGAGGGYFGVSADGDLAACHRFVGDPGGRMGTVAEGVDAGRQAAWLRGGHVHRQEPCRSCWARYLCGGGCHHEVLRRGRPACDYIRGWLDYALGAYARLLAARPDYFGEAGHAGGG